MVAVSYDHHTVKRELSLLQNTSCLLPISKQIILLWCIVTDNWQDGMRMCTRVDYVWRYVIPSPLVMTFVCISESAVTKNK